MVLIGCDRVYLDYNATTPLDSEVQSFISESLNLWANPSSNTPIGRAAKKAIENARREVAKMLGVKNEDVVFMSGGTEANNHVILHSIRYFHDVICKDKPQLKNKLPHIITTEIDHYSIRLALEALVKQSKCETTLVPVNKNTGAVDPALLEHSIRAETCLVTVMLANNETGVLQPVQQVSNAVRRAEEKFGHKIFMHSDAAQVIGKLPVTMNGCDYLSVVGHKFYGPRSGALICAPFDKVAPFPLFYGGGQERNVRPGTENTPAICGLGKAAQIVTESIEQGAQKLKAMRDRFERRLKEEFGDKVRINFEASDRLPNTSSVAFSGCDSSFELLKSCTSFYASTGAACHSGCAKASSILLASGVSEFDALRTVRFSMGRMTTDQDLEKVVQELKTLLR